MKTQVVAAFIIAATIAVSMAPLAASNAMAGKGGVNPGGTTDTECIHNGNGDTTSGSCSNPSGTTVTTTCAKVHGKFTCTTS